MAKDKAWAARTAGATSKEGWDERNDKLDGYNTPEPATLALLNNFTVAKKVWEPASGYHCISDVLTKNGHEVYKTDVHEWVPDTYDAISDFMSFKQMPSGYEDADIITNPPFRYAQEFVEQSMNLLAEGQSCGLLLRLQFMEGQKRKAMFQKYPPRVYTFSKRIPRMHMFNHVENGGKTCSSTLCFAWFVFTKGYTGPSINYWI
jgi:hypothetical protein